MATPLTRDEAELYDRQIRLWGVGAQSRIRQSKVLMIGFNGLASEVAKILVLAGIDTLTIVDDQPLQLSDHTSNLFCRPTQDKDAEYRTHNVAAKLKTLNPLVKVVIDNSPVDQIKTRDFDGYNLVTLHSFLSIDDISEINEKCRQSQAKFYLVLDFGFFGFMFNDLGPEFKFAHEEFKSVDKNAVLTGSGGAKDPITCGEDVSESRTTSQSDGDHDDDEGGRPKKRRRHHSPGKQSPVKVEDEICTKMRSLNYTKFADAISLEGAKFSKKTSPVLLFSAAMLNFYSEFKRAPISDEPVAHDQDAAKLREMFQSLKQKLGSRLSNSTLRQISEDWVENIHGSLSPVCAIVGGVAGQDMIRALSNKDIPIFNTFVFDAISMNGVVERLGDKIKQSEETKPVIRDMIQFDD